MKAPVDIRTLSLDKLIESLESLGEKKFRANQIYQWLWKKSATDFDEMTDLSLQLRETLKTHFVLNPIFVDTQQISVDGTIKSRFRLHDGHLIEGVLIPVDGRYTACVSSQVGCSLTCAFCATGKMDRIRNLDPAEIYDQVVILNQQAIQHHNHPLTNIVYMGMGEPLLNYANVLASIEKITTEDGLHMSAKRITVSTAGVAKLIRKLADDKVRFNLALSLHHTHDEGRNIIMPINESNSIENLMEAIEYFKSETDNNVTFEYILFDGINESIEDAQRLAVLCKRVNAKVNVIEYNPVEGTSFKKSETLTRQKFMQYLESAQVTATIRKSRGKDIDAACGQLANKG